MQNLPYTRSSKFLINKIIKKLLDSNAIQILKSPRHLYVCSPQWSSPHPFVICDFILFFGGQTLQNFNLKIKNRIFCHEFNFFGKNICQIFEKKNFLGENLIIFETQFSVFWQFFTSFLATFLKNMDAALYLYAFQYVVFLRVQYSGRILPTDTIFRTTGRPLFLCKHMTTLCFQSVAVVDCQGHGPLIIGVLEKLILSRVV